MKTHTLALRSAAALACLIALPLLQAANVTDDFSVAVTGGPAGGSTAFGYFSYNSASVIAGGGSNSGNGLLTDPAFTPDGTRLVTGHDTTALVWDVAAATGAK